MRLRGLGIVGRRGRSARTWWPAVVLALGQVVGCSSPEAEKEPGPPTFAGASLSLGAVGDPTVLAGIVAARGEWTASRRAELSIAKASEAGFAGAESVDLIVFPGDALGGLIDRGLLEAIPNSVVIPPPPAADPSRPNAHRDESDEAPEDPYKYDDLAPAFRDQVSKYGAERYALPLGGSTLVLVYRADAFASEANKKAAAEQGLTLEAPRTWDRLDALARFFQGRDWNGDGAPDFGLAAALGGDAEGVANATFLARAASLGQHRDQYSFLFDSDSMTPRIDAPPFVEALGAVAAWKAVGPPGIESFDAPAARKAFREGRTALLIDRAEKAGDWETTQGAAIGAARLPGSERVFEPLRKNWETVDVLNRPAYLPFGGGWLVGVRAGLEAGRKAAALDLVRYLSGPDVSSRLRAEHDFPMTPVRGSQMGQGPPDPSASPNIDVRHWAGAVSQTLMGERVLPGLRIPEADAYLADLSKGRVEAVAGKAPEAALGEVAAAWSARTQKLGPKRQLWHYRRSLNALPTLDQPPERGK